jgi:hypothetical protein
MPIGVTLDYFFFVWNVINIQREQSEFSVPETDNTA